MNLGHFGAGLLNGAAQGLQLGLAMKSAMNNQKLDDLREQGMQEAKAARQAFIGRQAAPVQMGAPEQMSVQAPPPPAVNDAIGESLQRVATRAAGIGAPAQTSSIAPAPDDLISASQQRQAASQAARASGIMPAATAYQSGKQLFADQEQAQAHAEANAPDVMEFFRKQAAPRIYQKLVEQGDADKAEAWNKWMQKDDANKRLKIWGGAYRAAQMGDFERAADGVMQLYSQYDDGVTPLSKEVVRDAKNNVLGFNVKLQRGDQTFSQFIDRDAVRELGLSALSEPQFFELDWSRRRQQEKSAADAATRLAEGSQKLKHEVVKKKLELGNSLAVEDARSRNNITEAQARDALPGETGRKIRDLRASGIFSEDDIREQFRHGQETPRPLNPDSARMQIYRQLMENEEGFAQMDPAQKNARINQELAATGVGSGGVSGGKMAPYQTIPNQPNTASKGLPPLFDPRAQR
ncbi:hypothetical protein CEK28_08695 [Xenophilus sp. AP218F]|nr:hypothetical protein CEK28_08695 [Xenophilus sp. AP218F]